MEYYRKRKSRRKWCLFLVLILSALFIYIIMVIFDKKVFPYIVQLAEIKVKTQTVKIINDNSRKILKKEFKYDEIVKIEKNEEGKIVLVQLDSVKLNTMAITMADECNKDLNKMSYETIHIPVGWFTERSILYNVGPKIHISVQPIGNVIVLYDSRFESAGINQTREKIYLIVKAKVRMKMPLMSKDIEVDTQVPVSETIIVGEIPQGAICYP